MVFDCMFGGHERVIFFMTDGIKILCNNGRTFGRKQINKYCKYSIRPLGGGGSSLNFRP